MAVQGAATLSAADAIGRSDDRRGLSGRHHVKLWQVDALVSQGRTVSEAVRTIGVTQFT